MRWMMLCLALVLAGPAAANPDCASLPTDVARAQCFADSLGGAGAPDVMPPPAITGTPASPAVTAALEEAQIAYMHYFIGGYEHRRQVFWWQLISSVVIFLVSILIVVVGLRMSWLQFAAGIYPTKGTPKPEDDAPPEPPKPTNLKLSLEGLEVSSPVIGIVILVISLAFFYLYLVHVYPIEELF